MEDYILKRIADWSNLPFNHDTISEIKSLANKKNEDELYDRFYTQLKFGTGGLRGIIGAGTNRMNIYTVGMATQGLASYIIQNDGKKKGVVIGCDSRIMSDEFAKETASILAGNGIKVFIFKDITPVPFVSFAVRELNSIAGVMITASHNPPEYNGYKVYWDDGSQIVPPHDRNIIEEVKKTDSIDKIVKVDFNEGIKTGIIKIIGDEITVSYIKNLDRIAPGKREDSDIKIVYSPIHGTGYKIIPEILKHFGFKDVVLVEDQSFPDGNFPTVKSPNPEEQDAMSMALELAQKCNADILMATDPDSDRMGIGFKDKNGEYVLINGNQIGTMLEYYILTRAKEEGKLPGNGVIVKTIVTTELQSEIAESFNLKIDNVLTGFKWIAYKMREYDEKNNFKFMFGGEESYGYLPVPFVRDKDAVSSCYFFAEMTDWIKKRGMNLQDFLDEIYLKYSLYTEDLHSLTLKGKDGHDRITIIMDSFRTNPPQEFCGNEINVVMDYQKQIRKNYKNGIEESIVGLPSSNVLQFYLTDGSKITMRPSGTEPKIKFYFSVKKGVTKDNIENEKLMALEKLNQLKKDLLNKISTIK